LGVRQQSFSLTPTTLGCKVRIFKLTALVAFSKQRKKLSGDIGGMGKEDGQDEPPTLFAKAFQGQQ
jgi:hypothetical protein